MPVYQPLERFLNALKLNLVGRLLDSDAFVNAAETGVGIFEMDPRLSSAECSQFFPIAEWVGGRADHRDAPARNIYAVGGSSFTASASSDPPKRITDFSGPSLLRR
jgi:hypothetical protein